VRVARSTVRPQGRLDRSKGRRGTASRLTGRQYALDCTAAGAQGAYKHAAGRETRRAPYPLVYAVVVHQANDWAALQG